MNGGWAFAGDTRVRRKVDDIQTFYHADGTEYSFDAATGEGYFTYYHQMSGRMIGFTRSDTDVTTWTGSDIVGSTSATRDENGQVSTHRYTPFGETRTEGNLDTDHLFTGQILDESSGLAFFNARYYDPAIGRFITPDSIVPNPLNGQDYNRYTYVRNNPVKYNDPTGNCPTLCTAQDRADVNEVLARGAATVSAPVRNTSGGSHTEVSTQTFTQKASNPTFTYNQSATVDGTPSTSCAGSACAAQAVERIVLVASFLPLSGEAIDLHECGSGFGFNGGTAFDCGALFVPFLSSKADDVVEVAIDSRRSIACFRSFSADTGVLMADGTTKPISEIEPGDMIWAVAPETNDAGPRPVVAIWPHEDMLLEFTVEGGSVTTTEDHHFWNVTDQAWQETQHIDQGDHLLTADGHVVEAGNLDWTTAHHADAYDLTIGEIHTYFVSVGDEQVLVHNCGLESLGLGLKQDINTGSLILGGPLPARDQVRALSNSELGELRDMLDISIPNRRADQLSDVFPQVDPSHTERFGAEESLREFVSDVLAGR